MIYVKVRSWHVLGKHPGITRCGLPLTRSNATVHELPMRERSCETCWRLDARDRQTA